MYNKIFTKILDSSIWLETHPTRIVWFTFLAAMDENGFAQFASTANLAHRARVTLEECEVAVKCMESPDENSSDPDNEGRRIERVHGGWVVLNSTKYRDLVTRAVAQEKTRQRVARFRAAKKQAAGNVTGNAGVTPANVSVTQSEAATATDTLHTRNLPAGELPLGVPPAPPIEIPYDQIIASFHLHCDCLPRIQKVTEARRRLMRARYMAAPAPQLDWFNDLFRRAQASDLLAGRKTAWRAGFDWLLNAANSQKVMEGNYENRGTVNPGVIGKRSSMA